jgi:uncharacterized protein (TIGR02001 family)
MKTWTSLLLAAAASLALAGGVAAQESPVKEPAEPAAPEDTSQMDDSGVDFSFNVGVSNDYVFRGISQTSENGQLFGGVDATYDIFYAGIYASNIDYEDFGDDDTNLEVDFYAGVKPEAYGFTFDIAAIYYSYYNQPSGIAELNFFEIKAAASRAIGPVTLGAAVYHSPDFSGELGPATYIEGNGAFTLNDRISFSGAVGHQGLKTDFDYNTFNIGSTIVLLPNVGLDLRYHTTDQDNFGEPYDDRFVALLKATF